MQQLAAVIAALIGGEKYKGRGHVFGLSQTLEEEIESEAGDVLKNVRQPRGEGSINEVFQGTIPFFISMIVMTGLLIHFPQMALWLPQMAFAK